MNKKVNHNVCGAAQRSRPVPETFANQTYLDPRLDPAFKEFFDSEDALKDFLNGVLELDGEDKIRSLSFSFDKELRFRVPQRKKIILDVFATTGTGRFLNIEMQNLEHERTGLPYRFFRKIGIFALTCNMLRLGHIGK